VNRRLAIHAEIAFRVMVRVEPRAVVGKRSNLVSTIAKYRCRQALGRRSRCSARDDRVVQNHNLLMPGELPNLFFHLLDQR
jgi:hypothetical protein